MVTKKGLAQKIKFLREDLDLSQEVLAEKLGVKRPTISQIESGQREISSLELAKFAKIFGLSVDELLHLETEEKKCVVSKKIKVSEFSQDKFKQVLLYILEKCGARANVGETVIYKLLYFCDFNFYELHERPLTGEYYRRIEHGPAPCHFNEIIREMIEEGEVKKITAEYYGMFQKKYIPQVKPDLKQLNGEEMEVIDDVIDRLSSMNATAIEDHSHKDVPYEITGEKEIIDYETVFYRKPAYSVREYEED